MTIEVNESDYLERRRRAELELAAAAKDANARRIHTELALIYEARLSQSAFPRTGTEG